MKVSRWGKSRKSLVMLAASGALLLSSCSQNAPGVAADVEGARITDSQVDDFARVLCALDMAPTPEGAQGSPSRGVRLRSLDILLNIETAAKIADLDTADQKQVAQAVQQAAATRDIVPEEYQDTFDEAVREYAEAQLALTALGRESLIDQGQAAPDDAAAFAEGDRLRVEYASQADITIDPRFGELVDGVLTPSGGSLSVPVSDLATQAQADEPSAAYLTSLPVSQTCS